jgi:hypothetical protein
MRRLIPMGMAALMLLAAGPAFAGYGALARDQGTGKFGLSWNEETARRAEEVAMRDCGEGSCKIVFRMGPHQCGAIATPEKGKAWGAAYKDRRDAAELSAMKDCQKNTGEQCKIRAGGCNR